MTDTATKAGQPTEGAVKAAGLVSYCAEINDSLTITNFAHIIDREAVAPAVRELVKQFERITNTTEIQTAWAIAQLMIETHRHLLEPETG